jgi:hypothetical protein
MKMKTEDSNQTNEFIESLKKWRDIQTPGKYHELLKQLTGSWNVKLIFYAGVEKWETNCIAENSPVHGNRFIVEQIEGEITGPDEKGNMRPEPYSSTKILGYDNYKQAFCGSFIENQNSCMLTFKGRTPLTGPQDRIDFYGLSDEPMLDIKDVSMKYTLRLIDTDCYKWEVYALALGENSKVFDFIFTRK